jgi:protease II
MSAALEPYPPILALAGLTDPRVTYWEPAKWVAKLREKTTGSEPILMKTNMDAGHGGASGRSPSNTHSRSRWRGRCNGVSGAEKQAPRMA